MQTVKDNRCIMTEIDEKYAQLGGSDSFLGQPTSEECHCHDDVGRYRCYNGGSIYWYPHTGAHQVSDNILQFWTNEGCERGQLGYPMSDVILTPEDGRYSIFEGGVVYCSPDGNTNMAAHFDMPASIVTELIDAEVKKIVEDTPLFPAGTTTMIKVHRWYAYSGKRYYRVMQLRFEMDAEVKGINLRPRVDLDLYFTFELIECAVAVTLIREYHSILRDNHSSDRQRRRQAPNLMFEEFVDTIVHRELVDRLGQTIGKSVSIPASENTLASQLQQDGAVRLFSKA